VALKIVFIISFYANDISYQNNLNIIMSRSILDDLREYIEEIENYWLALAMMIGFFAIIAVLTLFGVYVYTRH